MLHIYNESYLSHPAVAFPLLKRTKSEWSVASLSQEDPASHDGMIRIIEPLIHYLPRLTSTTNQKTVLLGDQLFVERGIKCQAQPQFKLQLC